MEPNIREQKAALRRQVRAELKGFSPTDRAAASARACALLFQQPIWSTASLVLLYAPLPDELNIAPALDAAQGAGKVTALLRYDHRQQGYVPCLVRNRERDLRPGLLGILEPSPDCPLVPLNQLDLTLVPGVVFSTDGGRLGRGKGYYDRLLSLVPGMKCGVAFDQQVVEAVPMEPHDVRLNCILTPTRWLQIAG